MLAACGARLNWILLRGEEIVSVFGLARRWARVHASVYVWTRLEEIHAFFSVVDTDREVASRAQSRNFTALTGVFSTSRQPQKSPFHANQLERDAWMDQKKEIVTV